MSRVFSLEFARWLEENTEVIKEPKITLYRYYDGYQWGNYILEDIYKEYMDKTEETNEQDQLWRDVIDIARENETDAVNELKQLYTIHKKQKT